MFQNGRERLTNREMRTARLHTSSFAYRHTNPGSNQHRYLALEDVLGWSSIWPNQSGQRSRRALSGLHAPINAEPGHDAVQSERIDVEELSTASVILFALLHGVLSFLSRSRELSRQLGCGTQASSERLGEVSDLMCQN